MSLTHYQNLFYWVTNLILYCIVFILQFFIISLSIFSKFFLSFLYQFFIKIFGISIYFRKLYAQWFNNVSGFVPNKVFKCTFCTIRKFIRQHYSINIYFINVNWILALMKFLLMLFSPKTRTFSSIFYDVFFCLTTVFLGILLVFVCLFRHNLISIYSIFSFYIFFFVRQFSIFISCLSLQSFLLFS